jgi:hypothetical protein
MSIVSDGRSRKGQTPEVYHTHYPIPRDTEKPVSYRFGTFIAHTANFTISIIVISFKILTDERAPLPE